MEPTCPAGWAARTVLAAQAAVAEAQLPLILDDVHVDPLHDLRVAVRRSRSVLRQLRRVLPAEPQRRHAADLRWLQAVTGPTRDLDVLLQRWDDLLAAAVSGDSAVGADLDSEPDIVPDLHAAVAPVQELLRTRRSEEFAILAATLRSPDFGERWGAWQAFVTAGPSSVPGTVPGPGPAPTTVPGTVPGPGPGSGAGSASGSRAGRGAGGGWPAAADRPIGPVAAGRIQRVRRQMVDEGASVAVVSPDSVLHDLRKRGKELRYLLELFGATCLPADVLEPAIDRLKELQDDLGRHQDDVVHAVLLRSVRAELSLSREAVGGVQRLLAELEADQRRTRENLAHRFAGFTVAAADLASRLHPPPG